MFKNALVLKVFAGSGGRGATGGGPRGGNRTGFGNAADNRRRRGARQGNATVAPRGVRGAARNTTVTRYGPMI